MLVWHSLGEASVPDSLDWLTPGEMARHASMRFAKRRVEWLLARWTAKQALVRVFGLDEPAGLTRVELQTIVGGPAQGAPRVVVDGRLAPVGVSLTDRAGWAVCAVADTAEVGCDLELVEHRSAGFVRDYLTGAEQATVTGPPFAASADLMANLIWSAKESALKVTRSGLRSDTRWAEVSFPRTPASASGADAGGGWHPLTVRLDGRVPAGAGRRLPGWWRRYGDFIVTVVTARRGAPPRSLLDPPGLASATPSHSWLQAPVALPPRIG